MTPSPWYALTADTFLQSQSEWVYDGSGRIEIRTELETVYAGRSKDVLERLRRIASLVHRDKRPGKTPVSAAPRLWDLVQDGEALEWRIIPDDIQDGRK